MPDNVCPHCQELADAHIAARQANERATQQEQRADALEAAEQQIADITGRTMTFVGQFQAWGYGIAADQIEQELLRGSVIAPDYFAIQTENAALRDTATQYKALFEDMEGARNNVEAEALALRNELDALRASLSAAIAVVAAQQGVIDDLRGEIDKFMTNELIQERDALFLSSRRLLRAGGIMWRALKRAWQADAEQRGADAMRLVRALRDRDIEDARG